MKSHEINTEQSAIEKLTIIANEERFVQLTITEADLLNITAVNDDSILEEREGSND